MSDGIDLVEIEMDVGWLGLFFQPQTDIDQRLRKCFERENLGALHHDFGIGGRRVIADAIVERLDAHGIQCRVENPFWVDRFWLDLVLERVTTFAIGGIRE